MPVRAGPPMDTRAWAAIAASHLGDLPPPLLDELLDGARRLEVSAGAMIHRKGDQVPHVEVVVHVEAQNPATCCDLALLEDLRGSFVLVDQPTEDRFSAYPALFGKIDDGGRWAWR